MKPDSAPPSEHPGASRRHLRIDRLEIDMRGIAPSTAGAAARALGPALASALAADGPAAVSSHERAPHNTGIGSAERLDAGRIVSPASPTVHDLAASLARRIAAAARRGPS